jgi:hypothetical protein
VAKSTAIEHPKGTSAGISESACLKRATGRVAAGANDEPHKLLGVPRWSC